MSQTSTRQVAVKGTANYWWAMELTYPINLVGMEDDAPTGDVLTRHGEYLGSWALIVDEERETGILQFIADGADVQLFSQKVAPITSELTTGLAMSRLCASIRDWHEKTDNC